MVIPFLRRAIRDVNPTGHVTVWKIPYDSAATDDEDALVRHFRWLGRFDPMMFEDLLFTRLGSFLFGTVEYEGRGSMRGSLGKWEDRVEAKPRRRADAAALAADLEILEDFDKARPATPGPLTEEEFEYMMRGESELMRRVHWRLMHE